MDKFKQYLQQHESGMDTDTPGEELWQQIRQKSPGAKHVSFIRRYSVAACILILISAGIILLINNRKKDIVPAKLAGNDTGVKVDTIPGAKKVIIPADSVEHKNTIPLIYQKDQQDITSTKPVKKRPIKTRSAEDEITTIDDGYARLVAMQMRKVSTTPVYAESPGYFRQFAIQLKQMETDEATLKQDIKAYGLNDQLLEQLINIYQQKLNLLKSLQGEINKMNNRVKANQHPSGNTEPYFIKL